MLKQEAFWPHCCSQRTLDPWEVTATPERGLGGRCGLEGSGPALPDLGEAMEAAAAGSPPRASSGPLPQTPPQAFCRKPSAERETPALRKVHLRSRKCQRTGFCRRKHRERIAIRTSAWMLATRRVGTVGAAPSRKKREKSRPAWDDSTPSPRLSPRRPPRQECTAVILPRY